MSMVKLNVVGISGQAGAGKDEVAQRFVQEHGFVQVALADPLKRLGYNVFDFTEEQLWGPSKHRNAVDTGYSEGFQWNVAEMNLPMYGPVWAADVGGWSPESEEAHKAYQKLEDWFEWLRRCHTDLSPRIMLQTLGTEWGRDVVDLDVWVKYMLSIAKGLLNGSEPVMYDKTTGLTQADKSNSIKGVVVSDIRFKNELEIIPEQGGFLMRIVRPETDKQAQGIGIASHRSESDQLEFSDELFNAIIRNDGSLQDLYSAIDVVAETL